MSHVARKTFCYLGICIAVLSCHLGQAQVPAPVPVTPAPVAPSPVGGSAYIVRDLWVEAIITIVMVGLALFAICRSSNRS